MNFLNVKILNTILTAETISLIVNGGDEDESMVIGPFTFSEQTFSTILSIIGAESWESVKGSYMRLKITDENKITAIGNILENRWVELVFNSDESDEETEETTEE